MTENDDVEEKPLLIREPLTQLSPRKLRRKPLHWILFLSSFIVSFTPAIGGIFVGSSSIIAAFMFPHEVEFWTAILGAGLILTCILAIVVNIYGFVEADFLGLWIAVIFALAAWPGVTVTSALLAYGMESETTTTSLTTDCKWNNNLNSSNSVVNSKKCLF